MYGMNVYWVVLVVQEIESGMIIYYVNEYYDEGQIIFQVCCVINFGEEVEVIVKKVFKLEYQYFVLVIE